MDPSKRRPFAFRSLVLSASPLYTSLSSGCARTVSPKSAISTHRTPVQSGPSLHGEVDFLPAYANQCVRAIDAGEPLMLLAGLMVGCFDLFAREGIDSVAGLKGKSIGVGAAGSLSQELLTLITAQVGLDSVKDVQWVTDPSVKPIELFLKGKVDAFLGLPFEPQDLRARHIGHVILDTAVDRPWSQYFCCILAGNREFVARHPVATKRVMRAILTATDLCATEPAAAAQQLADRGLTPALRLCLPDAERERLQMARIRRGGHDPVLCAAPARRRPDQVNSAKDHRRRHGLALSKRAQTRAEGVNTECQRGFHSRTASKARVDEILGMGYAWCRPIFFIDSRPSAKAKSVSCLIAYGHTSANRWRGSEWRLPTQLSRSVSPRATTAMGASVVVSR